MILLNAVFRAIADVGSKLATAVLALLVARKAGASEFGVFSFAISFGGIAVTLGQFGQEVVLIREVARDRRRLERYYSDVLSSKLLLSVPVLLGALAVAGLAGMQEHTLLVVALMGFGFVFDYVIGVPFAVFQAYERVGLIPIVLVTQRWITTALAAVALFSGRGVVAVAAIYCTGSLLAALFAGQLMFRKVARPRLHVHVRGALSVTREAVPIGLGLVAYVVLSRVDMTMLEMYKSSAEVGQYAAAYRLLETTAFVTWSVNTAVLPTMSRLSPTSEPTVGFVYARALKLVLAITVPLAAGAAVLAGPIIALLYGAEYHRAAEALLILAPTITLFPASSLSCQLFYAQDARRVVAFTYAAVLAQNVVWNLIMIPRYSLYGAAGGTSLSEILVASTLMVLSRGLHGRLHVIRIVAGPLLGSAAAAAVMAALSGSLALAMPLGVASYLLVLLGFERVAFPEDLEVIAQFATRLRLPGRTASASAPNG